ncbi:hypothetical protein, partial [Aeromonas sanarellii]
RQGATVDQGMIVSLFPVNAIWVNSYTRPAATATPRRKRNRVTKITMLFIKCPPNGMENYASRGQIDQ